MTRPSRTAAGAAAPIVLACPVRSPGGVWRHVRDLAVGVRDSGRDVSVALPSDADALRADAARVGVAVTDLHHAVRAAVGRGAGRPVFHMHLADTFDRAAMAAVLAAHRSGAAVVLTEHLPRTNASDAGLAERRPRPGAAVAKSLFKAAQYACASRIVAVSDGSRGFLTERYPVPARKIVTIPNGIATTASTAQHRDGWVNASHLQLMSAGSMIRQKGVDVLIAAAQRATGRWTVEVWGDGPHRDALRRAAAGTGGPSGEQRVTFRGYCRDVPARLEHVDALVMPSRWEAFPYASLEAMAASRAVIGTSVDGLSETVVPDQTGLLVAPGNPTALAAALDELSLDAARCARMGEGGSRRVASTYPLTAMVARNLAVYDEACASSRFRR